MDDQKLKDYFHFDEAELTANRGGSLTEKQKTRLTAELKSARIKNTIYAMGLFLLAAIGVVIAVASWIMNSSLGMRILMGFSFGLIWPAVYIFLGLFFLPESSKSELDLAHVQGRATLVQTESRNNSTHTTHTRHLLNVGNRRFVVDWKLADVIITGDEYVIYFLNQSQKIVSAEQISSSK